MLGIIAATFVLFRFTVPYDLAAPGSAADTAMSATRMLGAHYEGQRWDAAGGWRTATLYDARDGTLRLRNANPAGSQDSVLLSVSTGYIYLYGGTALKIRAVKLNGNPAPWSNRMVGVESGPDTGYALHRPWGPVAWKRGNRAWFTVAPEDTALAEVWPQEREQREDVAAWIRDRYGCFWRGVLQECP